MRKFRSRLPKRLFSKNCAIFCIFVKIFVEILFDVVIIM
jgi:hypothetical protein